MLVCACGWCSWNTSPHDAGAQRPQLPTLPGHVRRCEVVQDLTCTSLVAGNIPPYCVLAEFIGVALFAFLGGGCDANSVSTGTPPGFCPCATLVRPYFNKDSERWCEAS